MAVNYVANCMVVRCAAAAALCGWLVALPTFRRFECSCVVCYGAKGVLCGYCVYLFIWSFVVLVVQLECGGEV